MKRRLNPTLLLLNLLPITAVCQTTGRVGVGTTSPTDQFHTTGSVRLQGYSGVGTRVVYADNTGRLQTFGQINSSATTPVAIPDNGCNSGAGASSTINVNNQVLNAATSKVAVRVNITHPFIGDLRLYLVAPSGAVLALSLGAGGNGANYASTVFSDEGVTTTTAFGSAPFTGTYKPVGSAGPGSGCAGVTPTISSFADLAPLGSFNPTGLWTLRVFDGAFNDSGSITSWSLSFSGPASFTASETNGYLPYQFDGALKPSNIFQKWFGGQQVGINTTQPEHSLDVTGTLRATGTLKADSNLVVAEDADVMGDLFAAGLLRADGGVRFSAGSPAVGRVLTATSTTGTATWQEPAAGSSAFRAGLTNSFTIASGVETTIPFTTAASGGYNDGSDFLNASHQFQALAAGVYQFNAIIGMATSAASSAGGIYLTLYKSGATEATAYNSYGIGQPVAGTVTLSWSMKLAANELVYWTVRQFTNANETVTVTSRLSGYRVD